jgi:hypothetical protein
MAVMMGRLLLIVLLMKRVSVPIRSLLSDFPVCCFDLYLQLVQLLLIAAKRDILLELTVAAIQMWITTSHSLLTTTTNKQTNKQRQPQQQQQAYRSYIGSSSWRCDHAARF